MGLIGKILGGILVVCILAVSTIFVFSTQKLTKRITVSDSAPAIPRDSASKERGRHLAVIAKCADCHGADFGGQVLIDGLPFARVVAPNLTSGQGGIAESRSDDDLLRSIRHGVSNMGHPLALMPAKNYWHMGDDDVAALVAYLRTLPKVDRDPGETEFGPIGRFALFKGDLDPMFEALSMSHDTRREAPPPADTTAAYGKYLANIGGCTGCHGPELVGGPIPGAPPEMRPAANITPDAIGSWSEQDFFKLLREGIRPDGKVIDTVSMPVPLTRQMTDAETRALWMFLKTVPGKATVQ